MNMKLAALCLFVSVASATWCAESSGAGICPKENFKGQATDSCCNQLNVSDRRRGCWVVGAQHQDFVACCVNQWGCSGVTD